MVLLVLFAGCVSPSEIDDVDSGASTSTSDSSTSSTASESTTQSGAPPTDGNQSNRAPSIDSFVTNVTGLSLTYAFNASDPDGDELTYELTFGDEESNVTGTGASGNGTYAFSAAGTYNLTLVVRDGNLSASSIRMVNATAADAPAAGGTQSIDASWLLGAPGCALILTGPGNGDGVYGAFRSIDAATWGQPFVITFTGIPDSIGYEYAFYKGSSRIGVVAATGTPPTATGTVPDDTTGIAFRNCGVRGTSVTYTAG